jgi:hypothetical protein
MKFRSLSENKVSDYRLLWASSFISEHAHLCYKSRVKKKIPQKNPVDILNDPNIAM